MSSALATIIIVPRERFSHSIETIENIVETTEQDFELLVVDGNSPAPIAEKFQVLSDQHNFRLLRSDTFLTPNQARNLGWKHAVTKYVVFVDNDLIVTQGWLTALIDRAEESGAWAVSPLYLEGPIKSGTVHMAGGEASIEERAGKRYCHSEHFHSKAELANIKSIIQAGPTKLVEFHCALLRNDLLEKIGPLDENLMSMCEHLDFCLQVTAAGGSLWLEPESIVSYDISTRFEHYDQSYFETRWSEAWTEKTLTHFSQKWQLAEDDAYLSRARDWVTHHRRLAHASKIPWSLRVASARTMKALGKIKNGFRPQANQ
jgi:GT2 family glycosyltransferase